MAPHAIFRNLKFLGESEQLFIDYLGREVAEGNVVLFAGAGLSFNARTKEGNASSMPGWKELATKLADRLESGYAERSVLTIADYYETKFGHKALVDAVIEHIRNDDHVPGPVHQKIVELNFKEIITTNYDTLIERAYEQQFVSPQVVVKGQDLVRRRRPPRIIKMNGCLKINPTDIALNGSDFLSFSENNPLIEVYVTKSFVDSQVLFIGFGLEDPAFRRMNERVLRTLGKDCPLSFSLQLEGDKTEEAYWRSRHVQIINLGSGQSTDLPAEDRILRVLSALVDFQRSQSELYDLRGARDKQDHSEALADIESDANIEIVKAGIKRVMDSRSITPPTEDQLGSLVTLIRRFLVITSLNEDPQAEEDKSWLWETYSKAIGINATQALVDMFCIATRRYLFLPIATDLSDHDYEYIARFIELVSNTVEGEPLAGHDGHSDPLVVPPELMTLRTLAALYLTISAPTLPNETGAGITRRRGLSLLLRSTKVLSANGLLAQDMVIRSSFLILTCLFAPISKINRLVETWRDRREESELLEQESGEENKDQTVDPTPEEYRLPVLGFHGLLATQPWLYKQAAESLWSRQLTSAKFDIDSHYRRADSAYRYRHLAKASQQRFEGWSTNGLQEERLESVLIRLFLTELRTSENVVGVLAEVLRELNRGWIFGNEPPEALGRAWLEAAKALEKGEDSEVSWEILILLTLAIDGRQIFETHDTLLRKAWRREEIDLYFFVDYIAFRLSGKSMEILKNNRQRDGIVHYECHLALWVRWMIERIDGEADTSLADHFFVELLPIIETWLCNTRRSEVRDDLLTALAAMRTLAPDKIKPVIRRWLVSQLRDTPLFSLGLEKLDGHAAKSLIDDDQIHLLLAFVRMPETLGMPFRNDLIRWIVLRSAKGDIDEPLLSDVAQMLLGWIQEGMESKGFDWLLLASEVRTSETLLTCIERAHAQPGGGGKSTSLFDMVSKELQATTELEVWKYDGPRLSAVLKPFCPDMNGSFVRLLTEGMDIENLSPLNRDNYLHLFSSLLSTAKPPLRKRGRKSWIDTIEKLILKGATGRGAIGPHVGLLSEEALRKLQDNLISLLEQDVFVPHAVGAVDWIAQTLREASPKIDLTDIEECLIQTITSTQPRMAEASLRAVVDLLKSRESFAKRNRARLRRIYVTVEPRRTYRRTSHFAKRLVMLANC